MFPSLILSFLILVVLGTSASCREPLNHPYPETKGKNWHLISMASEPATLDPVRMHDAPSFNVASNLAVTPFQYAYLKRPIELEPYLAKRMPEIRPGMLHGKPVYYFDLELNRHYYAPVEECLQDDHGDGTGRPVMARDLELNLKRNADPANEAFMLPLLSKSIVGFSEYNEYLRSTRQTRDLSSLDAVSQAAALQEIYEKPVEGVQVLDAFTLRIYLKSPSDRLLYFFAMPSAAPITEQCWVHYNSLEKDQYALERNMISSGPYYLKEWEPRDRIVLEKNELYDFTFPELPVDSSTWPDGLKNDPEKVREFRSLAGRSLPMAHRVVFYLIQSGSTVWTLFEQGYQDRVALTADSYEGVLEGGELKEEYVERGVKLSTEAELTTFGWIFNLDDPVLGENLPLRKAIRCALEPGKLIDRFYEGRAMVAHGLIPPGMEGHRSEPVHSRNCSRKQVQDLLEEAGYPGGKDPSTGRALVLRLIDVPRPASASFHSYLVEQIASLGIRLEVDLFDAPTYFEKRMKGKFQITTWGWGADYPDPQNFFQLFYGPNASTPYNEAHFRNQAFDAAYEALDRTDAPEARRELILQMNAILEREVPVLLLFHRITYGISQPWMSAYEPHPMSLNLIQYRSVDPKKRDEFQIEYNSLW